MARKLAASAVVGIVSAMGIAACSGDVVESGEGPVGTAESELREQATCRVLCTGDNYTPRWTACCDNTAGTESFWINADGTSGWYTGVCSAWGIAKERKECAGTSARICRNLVSGDEYFPTWVVCCDDTASRNSYWIGASGEEGWYSGGCSAWGIMGR